jgi:hypothetical protein
LEEGERAPTMQVTTQVSRRPAEDPNSLSSKIPKPTHYREGKKDTDRSVVKSV